MRTIPEFFPVLPQVRDLAKTCPACLLDSFLKNSFLDLYANISMKNFKF